MQYHFFFFFSPLNCIRFYVFMQPPHEREEKTHYSTWKKWIYFNYYYIVSIFLLSGQTFHSKHSIRAQLMLSHMRCVIFGNSIFYYSLYNNVTGIVPFDRHLRHPFIQFTAIGMDLWIYYMHHHHHHCHRKGTFFSRRCHNSVWNMKCRAWNFGAFYDNIFMSEILFIFFIGFFSFSCSMAYGQTR